jgi:hypothetical protein
VSIDPTIEPRPGVRFVDDGDGINYAPDPPC